MRMSGPVELAPGLVHHPSYLDAVARALRLNSVGLAEGVRA